MSHRTSLVAVCQLNSTADRNKNFEICKNFIKDAAARKAKMIFFPEAFDHIGENKKQAIELSESMDGPLMCQYKQLAKENSIWLSMGGLHEKNEGAEKPFNSHVIINSDGDIVSVYRKVHLFDIDIPGSVRLMESEFSLAGSKLATPVDTPIGKIGLGICYDLRFPEFALSLTKGGAEILTYPSAFTQHTGMAHWEALLRSRAIENQSYVIAAAQTGKHNPKRSSYGHTMIVDPWGVVIAQCGEGIGIIFGEIDLDRLLKIRTEMPLWTHRHPDMYGSIQSPQESTESELLYKFAHISIDPDIIFYRTKHSMAVVNRKCVLPGHVLVIPIRVAKGFGDLTRDEVGDLFTCVQRVQKELESVHGATSSTIAIQDGPDAGQTIPHLHVHVIPRKSKDIPDNDDIYEKLHAHDKDVVEWRPLEEMKEEAAMLRKLFSD